MRYSLAIVAFLFCNLAYALPNDQYGRAVSLVTDGNQNIYTVAGTSQSFTVSFPVGTPQSQVYNSINGNAPANYTNPSVPLNQQYTPAQYGQALISQALSQSSLSPSQLLMLSQTMAPYFNLLQIGALQAFIGNASSIPVDGTIVTNSLVSSMTTAIQSYLNGN